MGYKNLDREREYYRNYERARRKRHKEEGKCAQCNRPHAPYHHLCDYHRELRNKVQRGINRRQRERYEREGLCLRCGGERDSKEVDTCINCRGHAHEGRPYK